MIDVIWLLLNKLKCKCSFHLLTNTLFLNIFFDNYFMYSVLEQENRLSGLVLCSLSASSV